MQRINIGNPNPAPQPSGKPRPSISISPNPKKTSVRVDEYGNEIDPRTKKILRKNEQ